MPEFVFSQVCPWVLVVAMLIGAIWAFATRKVVPGESLEDRERLIKIGWEALDREHAARELAEKQRDEAMGEFNRTAGHLLAAVAHAAGVGTPEGDDDAPSVE